jgi:hypothetical protein
MSVTGCKIDAHYVMSGEPPSRHKDSFMLNTDDDEFKYNGPNIWKGRYGGYLITIIQQNTMSQIREEDITIEKQQDYKNEEGIVYAIPLKEDLAQKLNQYLNEIYD